MSLPSDVNPDVAEAARVMEAAAPPPRARNNSLFRKVTPEQYGFAAAVLVAFLGVAVCGPQVRAMRRQRQRRLVDRVSRAADHAVRRAQQGARDMRDEAARRAQRIGDRLPGIR